MDQKEQKQILQYLDKYRGLFNEITNEVMLRFLAGGQAEVNPLTNADKFMTVLSRGVKVDPSKIMQEQMSFIESQMTLLQNTAQAYLNSQPPQTIVEPQRNDRRFKDEQWQTNPMFSYFKQAYLLNSKLMQNMVDLFEFEDGKTAEQMKFFTRQYVNSMSPSNYVLTNPEVCRDILETEGECLARGVDNFIRDLENSPLEAFKIGQGGVDDFEVGRDLAATPGKVVYENDLLQLIQYEPLTEKVHEKPLLIVSPFINKFYILDLDERKSLVRWLSSQGFTVFMVSWVNPDSRLGNKTFDSYITEGVISAIDVVSELSGGQSVNTLGYCIGGTVLGVAASVLKKKRSKKINSMTLLTTLYDFSDPGEAGNYISEQSFALVEQTARTKGYFDGRILAYCFSLLRENNLFWSFFVDNYLKGKDPMPFDILYWNSDSTNIPAEAFLYYLRNTYLDNQLKQPNALNVAGVDINLSAIDVPVYSLATSNDHIVLWQAAYESIKVLSGAKVRFVLAGSGHVAGVVNPPGEGKYGHWTNSQCPKSPEDWLTDAKQHDGSWWLDWKDWLSPLSGELVEAKPVRGSKKYPVIESAPGRYVKVRIEKPEQDETAAQQQTPPSQKTEREQADVMH